MKTLSLILIAIFAASTGHAAVVVAVQNQETVVPVNAELGSILQLPSPVKTVTPSQYFSIQNVGGGESSGQMDVRTFHIKPVPGAMSEGVTFVLANGKALALRLMPTPSGEKFYDLQLDPLSRKGRDTKFLSAEMTMMRAMLTDELGGFAREVVDLKVATEFPDLEFKLARIYGASDLTGYVFKVRNTGSEALDLNLSSLVFGRPNRAVLAQADRARLEPCPALGTDPDGCQAAVRMVVRGAKTAQPALGALPNAVPPFAKASSISEVAK